MKTIAEQIAAFEAKRAASVSRMGDIMTKSADEGRTLDETESQEYDGLQAEIKSVDAHITRLKAHQEHVKATAAPINVDSGAEHRDASVPRIIVTPNIPKGIAFTRFVKAMALNNGNPVGASMYAEAQKTWRDTTPQVALALKAAVAAGDTTTSGWASELVYNQNLASEFIELLRPETILGKMTGMRKVPFNINVQGLSSGSTAYWVGQGAPVPVSKETTTNMTLGQAKVAGLVVLTNDLIRSSDPNAEMIVRDDLIKTIATFMDVQFVDPNIAAVANVNPASITNGVTAVTPTGTDSDALRTDVQSLFKVWIQNNLSSTGAVWIMDPQVALAISLMLNSLGQPLYPNMTPTGGTFFGFPVIVSESANIPGSPDSGHMLILVKPSEIFMADDGQVLIEASAEAAIQMLDNPTNTSTGSTTATSMVSMWQTNSTAIRAVRFVNYAKRRSFAVQYIKECAYVA